MDLRYSRWPAARAGKRGREGDSIISIGISAGTVFGMPVGAVFGHLVGWRAVFAANAVLGLAVLLLQCRFLPRIAASTAIGARHLFEFARVPMARVGLIASGLIILVNNAGVFEAGTIPDTLDTSRFERQVAINYQAVVVAIREASRVMGEGGRIISLSTGLAARASWPGIADYSATKRAIEGYTKGAARDLGAKGITVNIIGTGSIDTDMNPSDGPLGDYQKAA